MDRYGVDIGKLCTAVQSARLTMRWSRERREFQVRQEAGSNWSEEASRETIPVNLLSLYKKVILRQLVPSTVRVMLSTFDSQMRPAVKACEKWYSDELKKIHFARTLQRVAHDALHGFGIFKVGLASPSVAALKAWNVVAGEPYAQRIDFDDWVWDIHARDWSECYFMGHRVRVPLSSIKDDKRYGKNRKNLTASPDPRFNPEGDLRIDVLARGFYGGDEEVEDMIELWEIYCPRHRCIITLADDALTGATAPGHGGFPEALLEQEYIGPDDGPYELLAFEDVVGNLLPKGPMMDLLDMHLPLNNIMRKLIRQAERQKEHYLFRKGNETDAKRSEDTPDGFSLFLNDPKEATTLKRGGPDQNLFQFFIQMKSVYSWLAQNLDVEGGLSPQGKTATQEKILNTNAGGGVQDMQERVTEFTRKVLGKLGWYHWHHPDLIMRSNYAPKGLPQMQVPIALHPWNHPDPNALRRMGDWEDIELNVAPLISLTPQQRGAQLRSFLVQIWAPLQQQAAQQGSVLDFATVFEKLGYYDDDPDYAEILHLTDPMGQGDEPQSQAPGQTEHVRTNVSQRTMAGNDALQSNALRGIDSGGAGAENNGQLQQA